MDPLHRWEGSLIFTAACGARHAASRRSAQGTAGTERLYGVKEQIQHPQQQQQPGEPHHPHPSPPLSAPPRRVILVFFSVTSCRNVETEAVKIASSRVSALPRRLRGTVLPQAGMRTWPLTSESCSSPTCPPSGCPGRETGSSRASAPSPSTPR